MPTLAVEILVHTGMGRDRRCPLARVFLIVDSSGGQRKVFKPYELCVVLAKSHSYLPAPYSFYVTSNKREDQRKQLPELCQSLSAHLFDKLTTLKLVNIATQDRVIPEFELLFLFEALQFLDQAAWSKGLWYGTDHPELAARIKEAKGDEDIVQKFREAQFDFTIFSKIWSTESDWGEDLESGVSGARLADLHHWNALTMLNIHILSSEPILLMFHSPAFPSLRQLILHGHTSEFPSITQYMFFKFRPSVYSYVVSHCIAPYCIPLPSSPLTRFNFVKARYSGHTTPP
ncbi:hypothetical protein JCM11641_004529 [Rhodosporidiobolus odoratus]